MRNRHFHLRIKPSAVAVWLCFFMFEPSFDTLLLLLAVLLHEMGHLVAMLSFGVRRIRMTFSAFGAEILEEAGAPKGMWESIVVSLGGVLANVTAGILTLAVAKEEGLFFAVACFVLAFLNLLPIRGLDGGRALEEVLLLFTDPVRSYRILQGISVICLLFLFGLSVWVWMASGFNFSLLLFTLYLSLSLFR